MNNDIIVSHIRDNDKKFEIASDQILIINNVFSGEYKYYFIGYNNVQIFNNNMRNENPMAFQIKLRNMRKFNIYRQI